WGSITPPPPPHPIFITVQVKEHNQTVILSKVVDQGI
ncbi:hypothetical protein A2U01_0098759, partial [Trifolium medium]|nr:hypothetical protein [Trifolium medium]